MFRNPLFRARALILVRIVRGAGREQVLDDGMFEVRMDINHVKISVEEGRPSAAKAFGRAPDRPSGLVTAGVAGLAGYTRYSLRGNAVDRGR